MSGVGTANPFALLGDPSDPKPTKRNDKAKPNKGSRGGGRGGRGTRGPKREYDRRSGTGRGREVHKKGHGKGGWGKFGEELGTPADDGSRPARGRGRRGRRGGRRGRGSRKGRGGRGRGGAAPAEGETAEGDEAKEIKDAQNEELDDLDLFEEDEKEEDPDNYTLEEYRAGLKVVGDVREARKVGDEDGFKSGKIIGPKKGNEEEGKSNFVSKKKKKKGRKVLNLGAFNESYQPSRSGGKSRRGGRGGKEGGRARRGGRGGRGRGGRGGRGGRKGGRAPPAKADDFPSLS